MTQKKSKDTSKNYFERFKDRWNISSNWQLVIIFIVFAVNGSLSVYITDPILDFFSVSKQTMSAWAYWPIRVLLIFPVYQVLLIIVGTLFGQFRFFWAFEKKTVGRFFPKKKQSEN